MIKKGDSVKVTENNYKLPGTVIEIDTDDTMLIKISGRREPMWYDNKDISKV